MDLLSSILDATLAGAAAAATLCMGIWMVFQTGIPSERPTAEPVARPASGLRQAA